MQTIEEDGGNLDSHLLKMFLYTAHKGCFYGYPHLKVGVEVPRDAGGKGYDKGLLGSTALKALSGWTGLSSVELAGSPILVIPPGFTDSTDFFDAFQRTVKLHCTPVGEPISALEGNGRSIMDSVSKKWLDLLKQDGITVKLQKYKLKELYAGGAFSKAPNLIW